MIPCGASIESYNVFVLRDLNFCTVRKETNYIEWVLSKFNGTSTPKGSYCAKTGDNDSKVNSSGYSLSTALWESIRYQAKSEQNVQQDLIPIDQTLNDSFAIN